MERYNNMPAYKTGNNQMHDSQHSYYHIYINVVQQLMAHTTDYVTSAIQTNNIEIIMKYWCIIGGLKLNISLQHTTSSGSTIHAWTMQQQIIRQNEKLRQWR